jgi:hypothetical protein
MCNSTWQYKMKNKADRNVDAIGLGDVVTRYIMLKLASQ